MPSGPSRAKPDFYTQKAKKEGYPARSVYKLEEIDSKFQLIKPGLRVLDVGASPGSWSLYVIRKLQGKGLLAGVDLKPLNLNKKYPNFAFFQGDIFSDEAGSFLRERGPYDLLLSDAAPNTSGNRLVDTRKSYDLVELVIGLAEDQLGLGGSMVVKVFQGGDEEELFEKMGTIFNRVKRFKPKAVRSESFEIYFVGLDRREGSR
ncbi:MAG: RlmE family RNA methyltransferase [Spirochaetales bacterium]|nr:RlmE family RNA methyltransferase [Spirochaetales bacterium]